MMGMMRMCAASRGLKVIRDWLVKNVARIRYNNNNRYLN